MSKSVFDRVMEECIDEHRKEYKYVKKGVVGSQEFFAKELFRMGGKTEEDYFTILFRVREYFERSIKN